MANYYEILEVERTATEKDIKSAYRKLAKKWHPDTTQFDKDYAASKFKEATNAYNVLSDAEARKQYDYNLDYEVRLREETRRREQARREAEARRREQERQEAERRRQEQARQEAERRRQEMARQEAERRRQEMARQEAERRRQEMARQEAERRRQEQLWQEAERLRQEQLWQEAECRRQEMARQEAERRHWWQAKQEEECRNDYKWYKRNTREKILSKIMYTLFGFKPTWYNYALAFLIPLILTIVGFQYHILDHMHNEIYDYYMVTFDRNRPDISVTVKLIGYCVIDLLGILKEGIGIYIASFPTVSLFNMDGDKFTNYEANKIILFVFCAFWALLLWSGNSYNDNHVLDLFRHIEMLFSYL